MISIRFADEADLPALYSFDKIAAQDSERRDFIHHEVLAGNCFVATLADEPIAYAVLSYSFFHHGFIEMVYVAAGHRRSGAGTALVGRLQSICHTPKLFTSTNISNLPMQALLTKMNFVVSGVIQNLDENDPEVIYFKRVW